MLTSLSHADPDDQQARSAVTDTLMLIINSIEFTKSQSLHLDDHSWLQFVAVERGEETRENSYGYMTEDMNSELAEVERMLLDEISAIKAEHNEENDAHTTSSLLGNSCSTTEIPSLQTREIVIAEEVDLRDANQDAQSWLDDEITVLRNRTERRKKKILEALRESSAVKLQRVCRGGLARRWIRIKSQLLQIGNRQRTREVFLVWLQKQSNRSSLAAVIISSVVDEVLQSDLTILVSLLLDAAVQQHNTLTIQNTMKPPQAVTGLLSRPRTSERRQRNRSVSFASVEADGERLVNEKVLMTLPPPDSDILEVLKETPIDSGECLVKFGLSVRSNSETLQQSVESSSLETNTDVIVYPLPSKTKNWQECDQSASFTVGRGLKLFKPPNSLQLPEFTNESKTGAKDLFQKDDVSSHEKQFSAFLEIMSDSNNSSLIVPRKDGSLSTSVQHSAFFQLLQHSYDSQGTVINNSNTESFKTEISSTSARNTLDMSVEGLSSLFFLQSMPSSAISSNNTSNPSIVASTVNKLMLNINKLASLDGIEAASNTRYLSIADNQISSLRQLEMLRELEFLNCDSNRLDSLDLGPLDHLATLSLNCNNIRQIDRIACPKLRRLELYSNRLSSLSSESFTDTPSLTYLNLGRNEVFDFNGMALSQALPLLHTLILSQNRLSMVPRLMLPCLRTLWLNGNALEGELAFSPNVNTRNESWLPSLKSLYLHDNRLSSLSSSFLQAMPIIGEVDLSFNRFNNQSAFQPLARSCGRLESLKVNDNAMPVSEMSYIKQWARSVFPLIRLFNGEETSTAMPFPLLQTHDADNRNKQQLHLLTNLRLQEEYQVMVSKKRWQRAKKGYIKITDPSLEIDSDLLSILKNKLRILGGGEAVTMTAIAKELHLSYLQLPVLEEVVAPLKEVEIQVNDGNGKASVNKLPAAIETVPQQPLRDNALLEDFSVSMLAPVAPVPASASIVPNAPPTLSLEAAKERCAIRIQHLLKAHRRKKQTRQVIRSVQYEDEDIAHILGNDTEDIDALLNFDWLEQDDGRDTIAPPSSSVLIKLSSSAANSASLVKSEVVDKKAEAKAIDKAGHHKLVNREEMKLQDIAEEDEMSTAAMSFVYGDHIRRRGQYNKSLEFSSQHGIETAESPPKSAVDSARKSVQHRESKAAKMKDDWGITDPKLLETMMKRNKQNQNRKKKAQGPRVISL